MKQFGTVTQRNFDRNFWHNPLKHKFFWYPKQRHRKGVHLWNFRPCQTKYFGLKIVILSASLLSKKFFDTTKFVTNRKVPLKRFSAIQDKKTWRNILILSPSPLLSIHYFATGNFLRHSTKRLPYEVFRYSAPKRIFVGISVHIPLKQNFFRFPKLVKH